MNSYNKSVKNIILRSVVLFGLWVVFSGRFDAVHLGLGVLAVTIVMLLNWRLSQINLYSERGYTNAPFRLVRIPAYILWLGYEILLAGIQVAYLVLHRRMPIKPTLVSFRTKLPSAEAEVVLGNSITLTPGTFTIDIEHQRFLVHAVTRESARTIQNEAMPSRVMRLFSDDTDGVVSEFSLSEDGQTD
jgi:multicomponent Na+:H+ antiporter subunit E